MGVSLGCEPMKIVLLQEERYLPNYIGGNKCTRALLEGLARLGHDCLALCPVRLSSTPVGHFRDDMMRRGIEVTETSPKQYAFQHRGVHVESLPRH